MKIKRFINSVLACAMVCTSFPYVSYSVSENISITANAVDEAEYTEGTYENLTYKAYEDHIEISDCDESATEVKIPSEIDGLPVTSIGDSAFEGCSALKSITIPDSVTSIGVSAFKSSGLESITIPKGVKTIQKSTFYSCSNLESVTIPEGVTSIGETAFWSCKKLFEINIPDSVTSIGNSAFRYCDGLTEITIKNPECDIYDGSGTISDTATIYGYEGSTAQEYAEENKREFVVIGSSGNSGIKGDANSDGTVDVADVVAISAYVGDSKNNSLDEQSISNADVHNTGDGLTANDALMIQQYLSGNITTLE